MISIGFGTPRFLCLGAFGFALAAATGAALANGPDRPELQEKIKETNQPTIVRPLGPIPTEEARQALNRMKIATNGPGTWRRISVFDDTTFTHTNIEYQWQGPDEKRLERSEAIQQANGNGTGAKTLPQNFVSVRNEEGLWKLHERVAILCPPPPPRASRRATAAGSRSTPGGTNATASGQATNSPKDEDLIDENDPEIAADLVIIGERIKEGDRVVLRISKRMGPKAQRRVEVLIEQKIKEMKKEIPLLLRPLLTVSMIKKMLEKMLPVRTDLLLDEGTNAQILMLGYAKDGRFVMEEWAWAPCPDLPPESYAVPKNLKVLRPKTSKEADQLEDDARKEDGKLRKR
jgi:hypothetical protein